MFRKNQEEMKSDLQIITEYLKKEREGFKDRFVLTATVSVSLISGKQVVENIEVIGSDYSEVIKGLWDKTSRTNTYQDGVDISGTFYFFSSIESIRVDDVVVTVKVKP